MLCCLCFVWSPFSLLSFFFFSGVALSFRSHKQATKKSDTYFSSQHQRSRLIRGVINSRVDRFDWFLSLSLSLFLTHAHSQAFLSSSFPLHTTHTPSRHHHQRATKREKEKRESESEREYYPFFVRVLLFLFEKRINQIRERKGKG